MAEIEIIGVRARPPFPCLRPGLDINRSRHRPVIASYKHSPYINLSLERCNVGIGTTSPTEALVVVGNANITGTLYKGLEPINLNKNKIVK